MAFISRERRNDLRAKQDGLMASTRSVRDNKPEGVLFYEFEPAIVLDVILDDQHPAFSDKSMIPELNIKYLDGKDPKFGDKDYSWIGRIKFRMLSTDLGTLNENLRWAMPLENTGMTEIPLVNELVAIVEYKDQFYYTRKINLNGYINASANFTLEPHYGVDESVREYNTSDEFKGKDSTVNISEQGTGKLGKTFVFNPRIRTLRRYEGDSIFESRFGSSIRIGSYRDKVNENEADHSSYKYADYAKETGNPMVLIRNRQADTDQKNTTNNPPNGYVTESINWDGSSIHMTSGATLSEFKTTCRKVLLQQGVPEEQPKFSPVQITSFKFPTLDGDQIIVNSDRLIFQARKNEFIQYAKQRFSIVTDDEFTLDAHKQIVLTTNEVTSINSPFIFLGEAYQQAEPALLGRTTTFWLYQLCDLLANYMNWDIEVCEEWHKKHEHIVTKMPKPQWVERMEVHVKALRALRTELLALQAELPKNMSKRVFLVGGGGAPGFPGGDLK